MASGPQKYLRQTDISAGLLGLSAITGSSETTSSTFDVSGYNELTLTAALTWVAASKITIVPEYSNDAGTTWCRLASESVAAGVSTLTQFQWERAVTASENYSVSLGLNYKLMRLKVTMTGGTTDALTITAKLGVL